MSVSVYNSIDLFPSVKFNFDKKGKLPWICNTNITPDKVWSCIMDLSNSTSLGMDGIPATILKSCIKVLVNPIRHVVNLVLMSGQYPDLWKSGIIRPLFKSGDKTSPQNYRPVCLQSAVGKVAEKVMCRQMEGYLRRRLLMSGTQHAYQRNKSTTTALLEMDSFIAHERD